MDRIEELRNIIAQAQATISLARPELNQLLLEKALAQSEFKKGDRVLHYGKEHELVATKLDWDNKPRWYGRLVRKDGTLGSKVFEMYGTITKC